MARHIMFLLSVKIPKISAFIPLTNFLLWFTITMLRILKYLTAGNAEVFPVFSMDKVPPNSLTEYPPGDSHSLREGIFLFSAREKPPDGSELPETDAAPLPEPRKKWQKTEGRKGKEFKEPGSRFMLESPNQINTAYRMKFSIFPYTYPYPKERYSHIFPCSPCDI